MMMQRLGRWKGLGIAGVGVALLVGGCRTTPVSAETPGVVIRHADGSTEITREVVFAQSRLTRWLRVKELRRQNTGHGLLAPGITVQSTYGGTLRFEYRFCWFDAAGHEVAADTSSWKPVTMRQGESKALDSVAPTPEVTAFQLILRVP